VNATEHTWSVVLAGGEGVRLRTLTTDSTGTPIPKQYCSLFGGSTLLEDALRRGQLIVDRDRLCAIVSAGHARWWRRALREIPQENIICQPRNRGTGIGILLSVLSILRRDPLAQILFLPADHFFADDNVLATAAETAVNELSAAPDDIVILGMEPREADVDLGYILCGRDMGRSRRVLQFIEKPPLPIAVDLLSRGALWNTLIFASAGRTLLNHFRSRLPEVVTAMETALAEDHLPETAPSALRNLYQHLPELDFSRSILAMVPSTLRVMTSPACGWSDLGTPTRIGDVVRRLSRHHLRAAPARRRTAATPICLAAKFDLRAEAEGWVVNSLSNHHLGRSRSDC
jgi:mannose-1-phosphate guanylyltransferase